MATNEMTSDQVAAAWEECTRGVTAAFEQIKKVWQDFRVAFQDASRSVQIALYGGIPGTEVPEVWEAFAHSLLDAPRPPVDAPDYAAVSRERAEDVTRYLVAVARQRGD